MADSERIGVWGHSMGGGISIQTAVIDQNIDAVVLYGSMNADTLLNHQRIYSFWTNGQEGEVEISTPPEVMQQISPVYFLDRITAAVSIHHGSADTEVPAEWSDDLCQRLTDLQKSVECFTYAGAGHILRGADDTLFQQRVVSFFQENLR
jgi:dipeptidyl aminopeptidase/acylaminoacyl peptidase